VTTWWGSRSRSQPRPRRALLAWWGAFRKGGGATVGDYYAVINVARWLSRNGMPHAVINGTDSSFGDIPTVPPDVRDDGKYDRLVFVCGPLATTRSMRRLLKTFRDLKKVAVGVSIIERASAQPMFDSVVARDSAGETTFDLALAESYAALSSPVERHFAICLRGMQKTYGRENCLSDTADSVLVGIAKQNDPSYATIDTVLHPDNGIAKIESDFASTSVLATTRMHGALFSLASRVPFLAVDQIRGGAKVSRLMLEIDWPWSVRADSLDRRAVEAAAAKLLSSGWTQDMEHRRTHAITLSRAALERSGHAILAAN
jgi:hypothetical protein